MKENIERLFEPKVICKDSESTYCKLGLKSGPFSATKNTHNSKLLVGIIGLKELIERSKEWLQQCNDFVESEPVDERETEINKNLFPDFPGAELAFETQIITDDSLIKPIILTDLAQLDRRNNYKYFTDLLALFELKIKTILEGTETRPNVILCVLTDEMYDTCHILGDYHRRLVRRKKHYTEQLNLFQDFDSFRSDKPNVLETEQPIRYLRSALKKMVMQPGIGIPIQIIKESTLYFDDKGAQNKATKSWNLCTGLFYKAGQLPWILKDIDHDTCFLGISHYHKKDRYSDIVYTSLAHLFSNDFEGMVLRGSKMNFDPENKSPYLDNSQAKDLLSYALNEYKRIKNTIPRRIVIHKASNFIEDEISGYREILENQRIEYDLITLNKSTFKLIRQGNYPMPRGTIWRSPDETYFLYTKGFVPELDTYPGVHIPAPFQIKKARGDSSYKQICYEVLALTKLNWNTADFCCGLPITIGFARNVGKIFKEFDDNPDFEPQRSYRFYM